MCSVMVNFRRKLLTNLRKWWELKTSRPRTFITFETSNFWRNLTRKLSRELNRTHTIAGEFWFSSEKKFFDKLYHNFGIGFSLNLSCSKFNSFPLFKFCLYRLFDFDDSKFSRFRWLKMKIDVLILMSRLFGTLPNLL